jgi:phosphate transport system permease protein
MNSREAKHKEAKQNEKIAKVFLWAAGIISVGFLLFIVLYVLIGGISALSWDFLFGKPEAVGMSGVGPISASIVATLMLIGITMVILIPLGIGAAIYFAEYAPDNWLTRLIRHAIQLLAGVPSIVFGIFGFAIFVIALHFGHSILAGALTLVCLLLPFLVGSAEEAMRAVPQTQREAALALGATKWQTVRHVVIPGAMPGIVTGIILCIGGAIAESAPLLVTTGTFYKMPTSPLDPGRPLALDLWYRAMHTQAPDEVVLGIGAVLIIIIVILNILTRWLAGRIRAKMEGGA